MIKFCLVSLILFCLYLIYYNKDSFTTCNNSDLLVTSLLINGTFSNEDQTPKAHIFWKIPDGIKSDDILSYFIIYKSVDNSDDIIIKIPKNSIKINGGIQKYTQLNLKHNTTYNITINMLYKIEEDDKDPKKYLISSNTLILNSDEINNEMIQHLSNPNDVFNKLKEKTFDIYL
jgi:hypothetical protein